jgi:hypothetical protein
MLPRLTVLPFLPLLLLIPGTTHAAPETLTAGTPISAPWSTPEVLGAELPPPLAAQAGVLFVNFDGADMNGCGWGNNDPKNNCSTIFKGNVLPYSGDAGKRAAVVQSMRKDFQDFNITVTDQRPGDNVDYDMEMIGDWDPAPQGGFAGVAPSIDCFNGTGGETSFTLDYTGSAGGIARAALQEVAHTWGLEHVESTGDLLYPTTAGVADPSFKDECFQIVQLDDANKPVPSGAECTTQHKQFCGVGTKQNSYRELLQIFGPSVPDLSAPTLEIVAPADGAEIEGQVDLTIEAADEQSPMLLGITITGMGPIALDGPTEYYPSPAALTFPIKGLPPGAYDITVTVADEDQNLSEASVHFTVVEAPAPGTSGDEGSSGDDTGAPTTGQADTAADDTAADDTDPTADTAADDTGAAEDTGPADPTGPSGNSDGSGTADGDAGDDGCGCRTTDARSLAPLLLPLALGLRRRRAPVAPRRDRR